jgi:hypothetical protein
MAALAQELPGTFLIRLYKDKLVMTIKKPMMLPGFNHIGITLDNGNYSISESEAFVTLADLVWVLLLSTVCHHSSYFVISSSPFSFLITLTSVYQVRHYQTDWLHFGQRLWNLPESDLPVLAPYDSRSRMYSDA